MTPPDSAAVAYVPADALVATAEALVRAGQSQLAVDLLDTTTTTDENTHARLLLAAALAVIDLDHRTGAARASERLAAASAATEASHSPQMRWDLDFHTLRYAYLGALHGGSSTPHFGPDGRDPQQIASLRNGTRRLYDDSPDTGRRGWASVLQGWVADNIAGDRSAAPAYYREALACAESAGDDYLAFESLRHLGDHEHDDGDQELARQRWERATECAARAGAVPGTLAQHVLLAVLARDAGDEAGAQALGREIARWAGAIGSIRIRDQALAFLDGVDPTAPPPDVDR